MAREGVPLNVSQRQLGHANLRVSSIYLQRIDSTAASRTTNVPEQPYLLTRAARLRAQRPSNAILDVQIGRRAPETALREAPSRAGGPRGDVRERVRLLHFSTCDGRGWFRTTDLSRVKRALSH